MAYIVDDICRISVPYDLSDVERWEVIWCEPTKSGKLPKCVAKTMVVWDFGDDSSMVCHMKHLADAEPYAADVYTWKGVFKTEYTVRVKEGKLALVNSRG